MKKGEKAVKDITGLKNFLITVVSFAYISKKRTYWNCMCECGKKIVFSRKRIQETKKLSCGCIPQINQGINKLNSFEESIQYKMNCIKNYSHWHDDCLIWDGSVDGSGCARVSFLSICISLKDLIWFFENRKPLGCYKIFLECGNKRCINIKHFRTENGRRNKTIDRLFKISQDRG